MDHPADLRPLDQLRPMDADSVALCPVAAATQAGHVLHADSEFPRKRGNPSGHIHHCPLGGFNWHSENGHSEHPLHLCLPGLGAQKSNKESPAGPVQLDHQSVPVWGPPIAAAAEQHARHC